MLVPKAYSNSEAEAVENCRMPSVFRVPRSPWPTTCSLLSACNYTPSKVVRTFSDHKTTLAPMLTPCDPAASAQPLTVVEDLPFTWDSAVGKYVSKFMAWNAFMLTSQGRELASQTLIISQKRSIAKCHRHPVAFVNGAIEESKFYILYDSLEAKRLIPSKAFPTHTQAAPVLSIQEFMQLKSSCFARITSYPDGNENSTASLLSVPSWFSHDVFTTGTGTSNAYSGYCVLGMPATVQSRKLLIYAATLPNELRIRASKAQMPTFLSVFPSL